MAELSPWSLAVGEDKSLVDTIDTDETVTSWTVVLYVYDTDNSVLFQKTATMDNTAKTATFSILAADTDGILTGPYTYQIRRTNSGFNTLLSYGQLSVYQPEAP